MNLVDNNRIDRTEFSDYKKVPVDPNLTSTLTPEYDLILRLSAESAPKRKLDSQELSFGKSEAIRDPKTILNAPLENIESIYNYWANPGSNRTALEKKIADMDSDDAAKYIVMQLKLEKNAKNRLGYLRELYVTGALKPEVIDKLKEELTK